MAGTPELYILQNSSEITVEEYKSDIKISESTANVNYRIKLKYRGKVPKIFNFSMYIWKEQVNVLVNDESFNYSYQTRDFSHAFDPNDEFIIKADYELSTEYTFSGSPGPWSSGYAFKVDSFPVREERWKSKTISVCEINVEFPNGFKVEPEPTEYYHDWIKEPVIEKSGDKISYSLKTKSECPYLTFSKITGEGDIFTDTVSRYPLIIIGIVVVLIVIGLGIFYKYKKKK